MRVLAIHALLLCMALALAPASALAKAPLSNVLGIVPGMREDAAHRILERVGRRTTGGEEDAREQGDQETWTLDHPRFTYMVLKVDDEERVQYVQGWLRKVPRRVRYQDIGDLRQAKRLGSYIYSWSLPARADRPALVVQARGADPRFPGSYLVAAASFQARPTGGGRRREAERDGSQDESTGRGTQSPR